MPGQKDGEQPKSDSSFHGPAMISDDGKTAYVGYGPAVVILDVGDIAKPKLIGQLNISPPFGAIPAHDVLPIPGKNLLFVHGEMTGEGDLPDGPRACNGAITTAAMIDIKDPAKPFMVSNLPRPAPPKGASYADFAKRAAASARTIPTSNTICLTWKSRPT